MKTELIKITTNEQGKRLTSARELYEFLEVKTKFADWFKRMCEYGFTENTDFILVTQKRETNNPKNPYTEINDFAINIDMAKEISMIQRTDKGKEARQYFIACEKQLLEVSKKALLLEQIYNGGQDGILASKQLTELEVKEAVAPLKLEIEENKPLVEFASTITESADCIDIGELAKLIKHENINIGRNKLYEWLRDNKYLMKDNVPYQRYIEQGIFQIKEYVIKTAYKEMNKIKCLVTGKGQAYIVEKLRKEFC